MTGRFRILLLALIVVFASACSSSSPTTTPIAATSDDDSGATSMATTNPAASATTASTATTALTPTAAAQADGTTTVQATIEFSGPVTQFEDGFITVGGLRVSLEDVAVDSNLKVGSNVKISGVLMPDTTVRANLVIIIADAQATLAPTLATIAPTAATVAPTAQTTVVSTQATLAPTAQTTASAGGTIIVIEGPVQAINVNVITIYSFNIVLDPNDPVLTVIQIGDVIRVQGERQDSSGDRLTIVLVAINIIFIDIDVFILEGRIWRDLGNCDPLPEWVDRAQVRRYVGRCGGGGGNSGGGNSGGGGNNNNDDDD